MEPRFFTSGRAHTRDQQINSFENWETWKIIFKMKQFGSTKQQSTQKKQIDSR